MDIYAMERLVNRATAGTFGRPAQYWPEGFAEDDPPLTVRGVWDAQAVLADLNDQTDMTLYSGTAPVFRVVLSECAALGFVPRQDDELILDQQRYRVHDTRPDGSGTVVLVLRKIGAVIE